MVHVIIILIEASFNSVKFLLIPAIYIIILFIKSITIRIFQKDIYMKTMIVLSTCYKSSNPIFFSNWGKRFVLIFPFLLKVLFLLNDYI